MKKTILLLGKNGMAGSAIFDYLSSLNKYNLIATSRDPFNSYFLDIEHNLDNLDDIINHNNPNIIINAIGLLVKPCQDNPAKAIYINSYFPHYLEKITKNTKTKVITLSSDCVFNGAKGDYSIIYDIPNGFGFYSRSKALGELDNNKDLTIRMSIIGKELKSNGSGLFEWFLRQKGSIKGYSEHWWTGITTLELAKAIDNIITNTNLTGIYQLAMRDKISKYNLLKQLNSIFRNNEVDIVKDDVYYCDKSLINSKEAISGYELPKTYYKMLTEYKEWSVK